MTFQSGDNQDRQNQTPNPGQGEDGQVTEPNYITEERLKATLGEFGKQLTDQIQGQLNNQFRGVQSMTDRVRQDMTNFDNVVKSLQAKGQAVDPNIVSQMQTEIMAGAFSGNTQPPEQGTSPGQGNKPETQVQEPPQTEPMDPFEARIKAIEDFAGIKLMDNDPEVAELPDYQEVGEEAWFQAVGEAHAKKKQRVAEQTSNQAIARSPLIGATGTRKSNPLDGVNDLNTLWEMSQNET